MACSPSEASARARRPSMLSFRTAGLSWPTRPWPITHPMDTPWVALVLHFNYLSCFCLKLHFSSFSWNSRKKTWNVVKDVGSPTVDNANLNIVTSGKGAYQCWLYQMLWASGRKNVQQTPLVPGKVYFYRVCLHRFIYINMSLLQLPTLLPWCEII